MAADAGGADRSGPRALVAGHGDFAAGAVSAVAQITGRADVFVPLTNRGLGADELERLMREHVEATGARVIFTDLPAGSCTIAARRLLRVRPELVLVTGANVAALLDFVFHGDVPDVEAARRSAEKGRAGLAAVGGTGGGD